MSATSFNVGVTPTLFPAGTVAGPIVVTAVGQGGQPAVPPQSLQDAGIVVFDLVAGGTYVLTAQRMDGNGKPLGAPVTGSYTVAADVSITIPVSITVAA